ncbi:fluoride efflux transporter CrcB [Sphingomonas sp. R647]|uniref:fluoride efflux transporter CrcB n=1 Tax=Sphingomonas sp. R647 TaxID=2875233 RepID=UPI001CD3877D|nr:fluoride efflux transporter CrcB [Sphingomonas sp. R647]MCA1197986.1 fluoride efflux transporter CrcB [Sphingomonas sp. R647]
MHHLFLVMLGGAIGAGARHLVGRAALALWGPGFPVGTLAVNVIGGLAMGLLAGWLATRASGDEALRYLLGVGVLGGFTTFSAFSLETVMMIERGDFATAVFYILASVVLAIGALFAGLQVSRMVAA